MGLLVTIDNGGTLTDICAADGEKLVHSKTLTTPHDLTECFIDALQEIADALGEGDDLTRFISRIDYIRYSTTQGTNALVQRKGPRLGWLYGDSTQVAPVRQAAPELFDALVSDRVAEIEDEDDERQLAARVSRLVSDGANRIVVGLAGDDAREREKEIKRKLYRAFPRHLLGAVPLIFSCELAPLGAPERRVWSALLNAFLHPAMETFLYNAEAKLRQHRARNPLLVFRNDGNSTRVARTVALKTYSSGPEGGIVGAQALIARYGLGSVASIDIGGTTTDVAIFENGSVTKDEFGHVEDVPVTIPLSRIVSTGVGGSSVFRAQAGKLCVGPESMGSAPGPACFARGGSEATITDALLVDGAFDPDTFFGGKLKLDRERAAGAIMARVGEPLGLDLADAVESMKNVYHETIAEPLRTRSGTDTSAVLIAFGGAGPMSACGVAERAGFSRVLIPRQAAVFSAYGIAFSDIEHSYVEKLNGGSLEDARQALVVQARRGMNAEGFDLDDCTLGMAILTGSEDCMLRQPADGKPNELPPNSWLELTAVKPIPRPSLGTARFERGAMAEPCGTRQGQNTFPLFEIDALSPGHWAEGPGLLEERFFTAFVPNGWTFIVSDAGDLLLEKTGEPLS